MPARFMVVFNAIRQLMAQPDRPRRRIGFRVEEKGPTFVQRPSPLEGEGGGEGGWSIMVTLCRAPSR